MTQQNQEEPEPQEQTPTTASSGTSTPAKCWEYKGCAVLFRRTIKHENGKPCTTNNSRPWSNHVWSTS